MRSWINKMSKGKEIDLDPSATAPGVVVLRQIWDIERKPEAIRVEGNTSSTDIYATSNRGRGIPQRRRGKRV